MTHITVTATRWAHGWELIVGDFGATQVRTLAKAEQQVRDFLDSVDPDTDHSGWTLTIIRTLGGVHDDIQHARAASEAAQAA
ncbi:MAG: hypothetical protein FWD75_01890 [Propionibacteriaceae bacterium]|nr:hypothetical protein [Propionibacteriaceae bacterium]